MVRRRGGTDIYGGRDPVDVAAYSLADIAHCLRLPLGNRHPEISLASEVKSRSSDCWRFGSCLAGWVQRILMKWFL